jgi:predicted small lipoprotein YifL
MRFCWGQYALWAVIVILGIASMLGGCGARGDLYLPQDGGQKQFAGSESMRQPAAGATQESAEPR